MNKFILAFIVCAFTVSAIACDGSGKSKSGDKKPADASERSL
jgi:hypothetical protein